MDPSGPADGYVMEVYENQRKKQPWGWGSGRKRHLRTSDPGRFSDAKGENRLHVKLLEQARVPAGWAWSAPDWTIVAGDCPRDKDGWTYGTDGSFSSLLADRTSGGWRPAEGDCRSVPELKLTAATGPPQLPLGRGRAGAGAGPGVPVSPPPPPPPDRPAGVRSRAWWRCMVVADDGSGGFGTSGSRVVSMGRRKSSVAVGRRKVPHAATTKTTTTASSPDGGGGNGSGDRIRVPLERLKRAVVAGPNTLIVDLEVEESAAGGRAWRPATLVVGPCDAPRLGSLLVERALTAIPRRSLGQVVRRARKLASRPPPLPPRPSAKGLGSNGGDRSGAAVVRATAAAPAPPKAEGSWQSDTGKLAAKEGTGGSNNNPFGPKTPPAAAPTNPFGGGGAATSSSPPPLPRRSASPFQSREAAATAVVVALLLPLPGGEEAAPRCSSPPLRALAPRPPAPWKRCWGMRWGCCSRPGGRWLPWTMPTTRRTTPPRRRTDGGGRGTTWRSWGRPCSGPCGADW
ncbi:unnamed protein product [Ectocarpus sp. 12 AP-2014]